MTPAEADAYAHRRAAYVHIPFCSAVCPYCDFAVVAGRDDLAERYVTAVIAEIGMVEVWGPLDSVYFGGGTPSHVDPALLGRILDALESKHGLVANCETTLEANPEDFDTDRADSLLGLGFNRVSFGAQSFDEDVLVALGRRHSSAQIRNSVDAARQSGFENVSIDLIYGTPGESDESWDTTLEQAIAMETDHVSAYALTVERGTALGRAVAAGAPAPDPDAQADRYEQTERVLRAAGLDRYEVSNWAKAGAECRYNLTVWAQGEYEAYGNGAHGFRDGRRFRNVRKLDAYIERVENGMAPRAGSEPIEGWDSEVDRLFVGLRRTAGVSVGPGTDALLASEDGQVLTEAGVLDLASGRVRVTRPLLTDAVHRAVLAIADPIVTLRSHA